MSSRKHSRSRPASKTNKHAKSSNIQLFKLIDPIGQSVLFVFFLFCIDSEKHFSYKTVLVLIFCWQFASCFINFLFTSLKLLRGERISYLIVVAGYLAFMYYFLGHVTEKKIALDQGEQATIPMYQVLIMSGAMILAFWYNVICYREFKSLYAAVNRGNNK